MTSRINLVGSVNLLSLAGMCDLPAQEILFLYTVTVAAGQATTPRLTFGAFYPAARMDWGDGTPQSRVISGVELNHVYEVGGSYNVILLMANQEVWITEISIVSDKVVGGMTAIQAFSNLVYFEGYDNLAWVQDISGWVLPPDLVNFLVGHTAVCGDISGWTLPANMSLFSIPSTLLSGTPILTSDLVLQNYIYYDCALSQDNVDDVILSVYAQRMEFTGESLWLDISGSNAAPTGIYQAADPPTTGKEMIYSLKNDNLEEGFYKWVVVYTA